MGMRTTSHFFQILEVMSIFLGFLTLLLLVLVKILQTYITWTSNNQRRKYLDAWVGSVQAGA